MLPGKGYVRTMVFMSCSPEVEDNQSAVQLAQNPVTNPNFKHTNVRHHVLRRLAHHGDIAVTHVPFEYQYEGSSVQIFLLLRGLESTMFSSPTGKLQ